jgi:ABC-type lipoprotein export system ATPase subunit
MSQTAPKSAAVFDRSGAAPILRAKGIHRVFKMGDSAVNVLKGADLTLRQGEFVAIEGRSGSGKSTLLHILSGLDSPDSGAIEYEGQDIAALAIASAKLYSKKRILHATWIDLLAVSRLTKAGKADSRLAQLRNAHFGFVFQFYHLLPELNVLENTMLASMIENSWLRFRSKRNEIQSRAIELLTQLGLSHRLKHRPAQLSGGERQRVAIARALMNNPRVLFADEPTGNLDVETGRQIMDVIEKLHRDTGQTIVMVTHDRALAREADRVLVLKDGKLEKAE